MQADDPVSTAEALIAQGRAGEAAAMLHELLERHRGGLLLRATLQKALAASGEIADALALARETAQLYPAVAPAALGLADALRASGTLPAAIAEYQRVLRLDPHCIEARIGLGAAWLDAGEAEKALESWQPLEQQSDVRLAGPIAEARRMLQAPRCDPRYVRHLFDQFAADYDSRMQGQLQYRAPAILRQLGELLGLSADAPCDILDLGCGTGLMGAEVGQWARRLDGVDLSPRMVDRARARGIYNELSIGDIGEWLAAHERRYDLIVAADTLVYLGDLAAVFSAVARHLAPRGHFLFTVEAMDGEGFGLGAKRRWRHSETWLRAAAANAGFDVAGFLACSPRDEAGIPVEGFAVALSVPPGDAVIPD
ncbi:MAG: methyltransferase domain-containing protein [Rhizomicrobium sp.]